MKIVYNSDFIRHLQNIWDYISDSGVSSANKFNVNLKIKIETIVNFPYKFRKSLYYQNDDIRDYIFKGYIIPYLIDAENNQIIILDIFK